MLLRRRKKEQKQFCVLSCAEMILSFHKPDILFFTSQKAKRPLSPVLMIEELVFVVIWECFFYCLYVTLVVLINIIGGRAPPNSFPTILVRTHAWFILGRCLAQHHISQKGLGKMKVHYILGDAPLSAIAQDQICREISLKKLGVKPILGDVPRRGIAQKHSCYKI